MRTDRQVHAATDGCEVPALWGKRERLDDLVNRRAASIQANQKHFVFRYRSPEHWLEVFKTFYGPVLKTFAGLPPDAQEALPEDLVRLAAEFNRSGDNTMVIPGEYLEVIIVR